MDASTPAGQRMPRSERRAQLLEAAQAVFVQPGYHAAAMDDIAEQAGVSKPVLYQHFPGKLDLYLALLDEHCETLERLVREALAVGGDNEDRVERNVGAYFDFVSREGAAFRMVFESDLTSVPQVRARSTPRDGLRRGDRRGHRRGHRDPRRARDAPRLGPRRHGPDHRAALAGQAATWRPTPPQSSARSPGGASVCSPRWA